MESGAGVAVRVRTIVYKHTRRIFGILFLINTGFMGAYLPRRQDRLSLIINLRATTYQFRTVFEEADGRSGGM